MKRALISFFALTLLALAPAFQASAEELPIGSMVPYAGGVVPTGWLLADGSVISSGTYPALYILLGTSFGTVGTLPDTVGNGIRGALPIDRGIEGGLDDNQHNHGAGTLTGPSHSHGAGSLQTPAHEHDADGTLTTADHQHDQNSGGDIGGVGFGVTVVASNTQGSNMRATVTGASTLTPMQSGVELAGALDVSGNTSTAAAANVTGSSASGGNGAVTGSTANKGSNALSNWHPYIQIPWIIKAQNTNTVPSAAEWGLIVLMLALVLAGTSVLNHKLSASPAPGAIA